MSIADATGRRVSVWYRTLIQSVSSLRVAPLSPVNDPLLMRAASG